MRYKRSETPSEFWQRVTPFGCLEWSGAKDRDGYGQTTTGMERVKAHRKSWEMLNGPVPDGLYVLHRCNNPACVRPDHLYVGTALDNGIDRRSRRRGRQVALFNRPVIEDIRARYASGTISQKQLADEYGTTQSTVSKIVLGRTYRFDLPPRGNIKRTHP